MFKKKKRKKGKERGGGGLTNPPVYAMNPLLDIYHVIFTNTLKTPILQVSKLNQEALKCFRVIQGIVTNRART